MTNPIQTQTSQLSFFDFDLPGIEISSLPHAIPLPRDFRITDAHHVGAGSLREKALRNLAALRTLKQLDSHAGEPTPEQRTALVRYSGWGALPMLFESHPTAEWTSIAELLQTLLTPGEFAAARATTPNAHYTSPRVIRAIWQAMRRLGLPRGARILEPGLGIGHFLGLMPDELLTENSSRTGVEIDPVSARIARALYPHAIIHARPFEDTPLPSDFFDAVVGNVPFGNYPVQDAAYRSDPHVTRCIHDYFIAKSVSKTRPGGILALITSRYTLDKVDSATRRHIAQHADLLGAIRLPNTTFQGNAGTTVTTDLLFLQRRRDAAASPDARPWTAVAEVATTTTGDGPAAINEYFAGHPEMMLGTLALEAGRFGKELTLNGTLTQARLDAATARLPQDIYQRPQSLPFRAAHVTQPLIEGVKDGAYCEHQDRFFLRRGNSFEARELSPGNAQRLRGLIAIREAVRDVLRTQLNDVSDTVICAAHEHLNHVYDRFVGNFGPVSNRENIRAY
jgi:hypothetical protein